MTTHRFVNRASGAVRGIMVASALSSAFFGVVFGAVALADDELRGTERILVVVLLLGVVGLLIPAWLIRMRAVTTVDAERIRVRLVGFWGVKIDPATVTHVATDRVDPMTDYRGYGVKGTKQDWMFGMSGTHGVRITHDHDGRTRRVTALCDTADEADRLAAAVVAVSPTVDRIGESA